MDYGFVYILINPAFPKLVKVGLTRRTASVRATELSSTSVPFDFIVVWDEFVTDCREVEARVHGRLDAFRATSNREFFDISIKDAVRALSEEARKFSVPEIGGGDGTEILPDLKRKFPVYLKDDIVSVRIVHRSPVVLLEVTRKPHNFSHDEVVERTDLGFISGSYDAEAGSSDMFSVVRSERDNARLFVHQMDEYSMIHCTDLFKQEEALKIAERHEGKA